MENNYYNIINKSNHENIDKSVIDKAMKSALSIKNFKCKEINKLIVS